jgi:hypothetical protein
MTTSSSQPATMTRAEPQKEHQWLHKLVGDWTYEIEATMAPDKPPEKSKGTERVRSLGGLWVLAEGQGEMGGRTETTLLTLGYDPPKQRYVGTWIGSMMTHLWVYEGTLSGNTLTLNAEGPSFETDGKMRKYRDVTEFKSDDHRVLTSQVLGDDGRWQTFMTAQYHRRK